MDSYHRTIRLAECIFWTGFGLGWGIAIGIAGGVWWAS